MNTSYKYKIVLGESDSFADNIFSEHFASHFPGQSVAFNQKHFEVAVRPYKNDFENYYTVELKQITDSARKQPSRV